MKRVLYLSSWNLFGNGKVQVPFIFEQIGSLSHSVDARYAECGFTSVVKWIWLFVTGKWFIRLSSAIWENESYDVAYYRIILPKLPTRITSNPVWKDFYIAGWVLAPLIKRKVSGIDLIHAHVILPIGAFAAGLKTRLGVPFLLQEHSGPFEMHCRTSDAVKGVRFVLHHCSMVLPVSESLKQKMQSYEDPPNAGRYRIVPNLLRTDIFKPILRNENGNSDKKEIRLISVCSAQKVKRHDVMFEIVRAMLNRKLQVTLTIFGIDENERRLVDLRNQMGLSSVVSFRGRVARKIIFEAFREHDMYVCTSDTETFGLAPAEALCSGLPVVSSNCGGVSEFLVFPNTAIVPRQDPELYVQEIVRLAANRQDVGESKIWDDMNSRFGQLNFNRIITTIYEDDKCV